MTGSFHKYLLVWGTVLFLAAALMMSGCSGFTGASILGAKSSGQMVVTDDDNNRVLIYDPPFTTNQSASIVLGQTNFTSNSYGTTASTLYEPINASVDPSGNLWVTDYDNNRILQYKTPFSTGMSASVVIGQTDFTQNTSCTVSASTFCWPAGSTFDTSGHLWMTDYENNRVLRFSPPFTNGMSADLVIGQTNFTSRVCAGGATGLCYPWVGVRFDASGNLWVADYDDCRVLEYVPPFTNGMAASVVIGQPNFTSTSCGTSATTNDGPWSLGFDGSGNLWVADGNNSRVLMYKPPFTTGMAASVVLGQPDFTSSAGATTASGFYYPSDVSADPAGNIYVSDEENSRVLVFEPPFTNGMAASKVIGQPNFTSNTENQGESTPGANTMSYPYGVLILP